MSLEWYPEPEAIQALKQRLDSLEKKWRADFADPAFFSAASEAVRRLPQVAPLDLYLIRDWVWVASQLRMHRETADRAGAVAWAGLSLFVATMQEGFSQHLQRRLRWLRDQVVEGICTLLGPASINRFIGADEREHIDDLLIAFAERDDGDPEQLASHAIRTAEEFSSIHNAAYFPAIATQLRALADVAKQRNESGRWARAALTYLKQEADVIDDGQGYLGLLDDIQVIQDVYEMISGQRSWLPLVRAMQDHMPLLSKVYWTDAGQTNYLPPYLRVIAGCALEEVDSRATERLIVLPEPGPAAFVTAVLHALASLPDDACWAPVAGTGVRFMDGPHMRYAAIDEAIDLGAGNAQPMIRLKDARVLLHSDLIPYLEAATVTGLPLATSKQFEKWKQATRRRRDPPVRRYRRSISRGPVVLVTDKARFDRYADQILPFGTRIGALMPVDYRARHQGSTRGNSGEAEEPALIVCSSLDVAEACLSRPNAESMPQAVFIDRKVDPLALEELRHRCRQSAASVPLTVFATPPEARLIDEHMKNAMLWYVTPADVDPGLAMGDGAAAPPIGAGPIASYMRRRIRAAKAEFETRVVEFPELDDFATQARTLRSTAAERQEGTLDLLAVQAEVLLRAISKIVPVPGGLRQSRVLERFRHLLNHCQELSVFDDSAEALGHAGDRLIRAFAEREAPKVAELKTLLDHYRERALVVVGSRMDVEQLSSMELDEPFQDGRWIGVHDLDATDDMAVLVVPGWLGSGDMYQLQATGWAAKQVRLLYRHEEARLSAMNRRLAQAAVRLQTRTRSSWRTLREVWPEVESPPEVADTSSLEVSVGHFRDVPAGSGDEDEFDEWIAGAVRSRVSHDATDPVADDHAVKARLVFFDDGDHYGLFAEGAKLICLNAVLAGGIDNQALNDREAETLLQKEVENIRPGDMLAFPDAGKRGDVIDGIVEHLFKDKGETRRRADRWREAVSHLADQCDGDMERLASLLAEAGVKRQPVTIWMWLHSSYQIAPRSPHDSVPRIIRCAADSGWDGTCDGVLQSIDAVYEARRHASRILIQNLSSAEIDVRSGLAEVQVLDNSLKYRVLSVAAIDPPSRVSSSQLGLHTVS